jgi:hypothetical protein
MAKHLAACPQRRAMIEKANGKKGESETLFHLRVQDTGSGDYWLDLEMRGNSALSTLDHYLRAIWLECCDHLSEFSMSGQFGDKIPQTRKVKAVFANSESIVHFYDFGTTSETLIKVVGTREGQPTTKHPIALMARNQMPEAPCIKCGKSAAWLCNECLIEDDVWGVLCDEHAKTHPHHAYGEPIPLCNSPRMGMCGYEGPAEPPY